MKKLQSVDQLTEKELRTTEEEALERGVNIWTDRAITLPIMRAHSHASVCVCVC